MQELLTSNPLFELPHENVLVNGEPYYRQVFEVIKQEIEIMSEQEAKIVSLGVLSDLLPVENFHGDISLKMRLDSGEISEAGMSEADKVLDSCYVPTTKGASLRCVDGRPEVGYDDNEPAWYELGPQVQGGTIDIAAARRLRKGADSTSTLENDIEEVVADMSVDHPPAGHTDDHARPGEFGCGAVKGQEAKLDYLADTDLVNKISGVVSAVYELAGKALPTEALGSLPQNAVQLKSVAGSYYANKPAAIEYLKKFNQAAEKVVKGAHNEYKLRLNLVPNTTLNTSKMDMLNEGKYQVFGLDVWYILQECGDDAPFVLADALATVMNLTDGSVKVDARLPQPTEELVAA